jgi:hypothetical protein
VMKSDEILIKTFDQVKNDNFDQVKFDQVIVCRFFNLKEKLFIQDKSTFNKCLHLFVSFCSSQQKKKEKANTHYCPNYSKKQTQTHLFHIIKYEKRTE